MIKLNLYYAKVIDNNDPEKKGKIQAQVLPEMEGVEDASLFPWFKPFSGMGSALDQSLAIPEINSYVWVFSADLNFNNGAFYLFESSLEGLFNFDAVKAKIDSSGVSAGDYPDIDFTQHPSGNVIFQNRKTGAFGVVHKNGSFMGMDDSGKIISKSSTGNSEIEIDGNDITVKGVNVSVSGQVSIEGTGSTITTGNSSCLPSAGGVGGFLGVAICPVTGAIIRGNTITIT